MSTNKKNGAYSRGERLVPAAEQFFSGKNHAVCYANPLIFPLASAKNSQKQSSDFFHSVSAIFLRFILVGLFVETHYLEFISPIKTIK